MRKTVDEYMKSYDAFCEEHKDTDVFLKLEEWTAFSWANDEDTFFDKPDLIDKLLLLKKEDQELYSYVNAGLHIILLRAETEPESLKSFFRTDNR